MVAGYQERRNTRAGGHHGGHLPPGGRARVLGRARRGENGRDTVEGRTVFAAGDRGRGPARHSSGHPGAARRVGRPTGSAAPLASENAVTHELELRRITLPRTPVNKGKKKAGATKTPPLPTLNPLALKARA